MRQSPKVSILIPAYNVAEFLPQCLDSIVNQTHENLQVVVVDDGSKDNTPEILDSYAANYPFMEVIHQDNAGVAAARNRLVEEAKGDYVLFVDADDWVETSMVERMLKTIEDSGADIVVCGSIKEEAEQSYYVPVTKEPQMVVGVQNIIQSLLRHDNLNGSLWNKLVPRKYYEGLKFHDGIWYGEDCLFFWKALNRCVRKLYFMPDLLYHHRMNNQSISFESFNYKKMTGHKVWEKINEDVQRHYPSMSNLGKAAFAVSDMWLLFYASLSNYKLDDNIRIFQGNVRRNLLKICRSGLLCHKKFLFAILISFSYRFGGLVIRHIEKR